MKAQRILVCESLLHFMRLILSVLVHQAAPHYLQRRKNRPKKAGIVVGRLVQVASENTCQNSFVNGPNVGLNFGIAICRLLYTLRLLGLLGPSLVGLTNLFPRAYCNFLGRFFGPRFCFFM